MAEDQAGPAGQEDNGEGKPGDEYRFAVGSAEADAAVVVGELVEEPGEVLGTIVSDDRSPCTASKLITWRLSWGS